MGKAAAAQASRRGCVSVRPPWAIHDRDDGGHLHAHLLLSQQIHDGSQRPRSVWFSRADSFRPQKAGAPRADQVGMGWQQ